MRAAPTQKSAIASAETTHLLPPLTAVDPIHNRDLADRRRARRSSKLRRLRDLSMSDARHENDSGSAHVLRAWCEYDSGSALGRSVRVCDDKRWTKNGGIRAAIAGISGLWSSPCHLRRPPVASALAAVHGIRRGLHAAPPPPAHAFGRRRASCCAFDLRIAPGRAPARRLAQVRSVRSVPSRDAWMRAAPTQKSAIASAETTHLLPPPTAVDPIHNRDLADRRLDAPPSLPIDSK